MNDTHCTKRKKKLSNENERKYREARSNEWMHSRKDAAAFKRPNFLKWNCEHSCFWAFCFPSWYALKMMIMKMILYCWWSMYYFVYHVIREKEGNPKTEWRTPSMYCKKAKASGLFSKIDEECFRLVHWWILFTAMHSSL